MDASNDTFVKMGKQVQCARAYRGITREYLSYMTTICSEVISKIEDGEEEMNIIQLFNLSTVLGIKVEFFFTAWDSPEDFLISNVDRTKNVIAAAQEETEQLRSIN